MLINNIEVNVTFSQVKPNAIVPSKEDENGGWDIYPCFEEGCMIINPLTSMLIPTGLASAFTEDYCAVFRERGSTGIKNMKVNAGVIDSGFRGEWFVLIYNGNSMPIIINKKGNIPTESGIIYPYEKAIAQALFLPVFKVKVNVVPYEELLKIESKRGSGMLGSSGK
jgi:dUTP pyrophosphatase